MFTIMHERPDGTEELFTANHVQYVPCTEETLGADGVHLLGEGGPGIRIGKLTDGRVFVMNDKGATVARYDLNAPKSPPPKN